MHMSLRGPCGVLLPTSAASLALGAARSPGDAPDARIAMARERTRNTEGRRR